MRGFTPILMSDPLRPPSFLAEAVPRRNATVNETSAAAAIMLLGSMLPLPSKAEEEQDAYTRTSVAVTAITERSIADLLACCQQGIAR